MSKRTYAKPESHRAAHKTRALAGVLLAVALIATTVAAKANEAFVAEPLQATNSSSQDKDLRTLEPGKPVERELARGQTHTYQIAVEVGQYFRVVAAQKEINVVLELFAPDGKTVAGSSDSVWKKELVAVIAEIPGSYRLDVRPEEPTTASGHYEVTLEIMRTATERDRKYHAAYKTYYEGWELFLKGTLEGPQRPEIKYEDALENLRASRKKYEQALARFKELGEKERQIFALERLAWISGLLYEDLQAIEYYKQVLLIWRTLDEPNDFIDPIDKAIYLSNLGFLHLSVVNEPQLARDFLEEALRIGQNDKTYAGAGLLSVLGRLYSDIDTNEAAEYFFKSIEIWRALNSPGSVAKQFSYLGMMYHRRGDSRKGLDYLHQALDKAKEQKAPAQEIDIQISMGRIYTALGDYQKADAHFNQALKGAREFDYRYEEGVTLSEIGIAHFSMNEYAKAEAFNKQALAIFQSLGTSKPEADALYWLALAENKQGKLNAARAHIEAAIRIVETTRAKIDSPDLRSSFFATAQNFYNLNIETLMQMHQQQPNERLNNQAFNISERSRARVLLEMLAESKVNFRQGVDPGLLDRERSLQLLINDKKEQRARLLNRKSTVAQNADIDRAISLLITELQQVQSQIRQKSPRYAALTQPQPLSLEQIQQQALDEDTLLIEYALGDRQSYAWAVTKDSISSYTLPPRQEIDAIARRVYDSLIARQLQVKESPAQRDARLEKADADFQTSAAELSRLILAPAAEHLGNKRLLIVADGALQYIPFAALPEPVASRQTALGSRPASVSRKHAQSKTPRAKSAVRYPPSAMARPLMLDHEIVSLPSASVMALIRQETAGRTMPEKIAAALADPVFDNDDDRVKPAAQNRLAAAPRDAIAELKLKRTVRAMARASETLPRLFFTRDEAKAIQALTPSAMIALGFDANRAKAMSAELAQYRYVHFATHGLLNAQQPELSGLVFSLLDQAGNRQDGLLGLSEVYNLNLPVEMVVLSACDTARGKEMRGEGLIGLTRGFMYAGAKRVVASLWRVDDATTSELMKRFYQRVIQQGERPAAALRAAQKATWQRLDTRAPYHWAAFVMQGEWR